MTVSPGHLDDLLNVTFPSSDFGGLAFQSLTGNPPTGSYSLTATTTGTPAPGTISDETADETLRVVSLNDSNDTLTFSISVDGQPSAQLTEYVIGYSSNSLLLSGVPSLIIASYASSSISSDINGVIAVLSAATIPAETNITFASTGNTTIAATPAPTPTPSAPLTVLDTTTGKPVDATPQPYTGPVAGLTSEYISVSSDSLNITTTTPNWFLHSGSGTDALNVSAGGGTNVLDGSTGSNFLTGGSGDDTFFLDDRNPTADVFSTVVGFHSGDNATVFGVTPSDFTLNVLDNQGAAGYTGVDFGFSAPGHANANFVLAGFTSADLSNGRLTVTYGTTPDAPGAPGSMYMLIHAN